MIKSMTLSSCKKQMMKTKRTTCSVSQHMLRSKKRLKIYTVFCNWMQMVRRWRLWKFPFLFVCGCPHCSLTFSRRRCLMLLALRFNFLYNLAWKRIFFQFFLCKKPDSSQHEPLFPIKTKENFHPIELFKQEVWYIACRVSQNNPDKFVRSTSA